MDEEKIIGLCPYCKKKIKLEITTYFKITERKVNQKQSSRGD